MSYSYCKTGAKVNNNYDKNKINVSYFENRQVTVICLISTLNGNWQ